VSAAAWAEAAFLGLLQRLTEFLPGNLPIALLGLLFKDAIKTSLRNLYITAAMLIGFALLVWAADRWGSQRRVLNYLGWRHGLLFGLAQALALMPGVSRPGGALTAGLLMATRVRPPPAIPACWRRHWRLGSNRWLYPSPIRATAQRVWWWSRSPTFPSWSASWSPSALARPTPKPWPDWWPGPSPGWPSPPCRS